MKLILTEKPAVAREIADAVGANIKGEGFIKNSDYTITWAFGHLLKIDDKHLPDGNWSFDNLPLFPDRFNYVTTASTAKQFKIIKDLLTQASEVIISTDAGNEGELIARSILIKGGWSKWNNTYRLWTSEALSKTVILKCLQQLAPASKYDSNYYAALTRQHSDWLCGINLTQAVTIQSGGGGVWSVGRVQSPTLRMIIDRHNERLNFKPEAYYILKATFSHDNKSYDGYYFKADEKSAGTSTEDGQEPEQEEGKKINKIYAKSVVDYLFNTPTGKIISINKNTVEEIPPLLHSLTSLQREANTSFGLSAQNTLDIAQDLYEKHKILSYPRTDSQHMAESSTDLVKTVLAKLGKENLVNAVNVVGKRVFNDSKLTDHYAIIPLASSPEGLSKDEANVFNLVCRKFIGAFMPLYRYETTEVITSVKDCTFKTNGKITLALGWKSLYGNEDKTALPALSLGMEVRKDKLDVLERYTKPAPAFTEASLLARMEKLNLGTPATRADIIEKLLLRQYIFREKKNLVGTPKGVELILKAAGRKFIDPEFTAAWDLKLEGMVKTGTGETSYGVFIQDIKRFVTEEIENIKKLEIKGENQASLKMLAYAKSLAQKNKQKLTSTTYEYINNFISQYKDVAVSVGKCSCGHEIQDNLYSWNCSCGKKISKEIFKKKLTPVNAVELMNGKTISLKGCTGQKGKFDAKLKLGEDKVKLEFVR